MVSTISRRECIHQTTLNCNITPSISSILQRLFHGGKTEAARQHGAYPTLDAETREELAAEAFLRGYKNMRVAYLAMNTNRLTLAQAWKLVDCYEHNYKVTVGRDPEPLVKGRTRSVTWAPDGDPSEIQWVAIHPPTPPTQTWRALSEHGKCTRQQAAGA